MFQIITCCIVTLTVARGATYHDKQMLPVQVPKAVLGWGQGTSRDICLSSASTACAAGTNTPRLTGSMYEPWGWLAR